MCTPSQAQSFLHLPELDVVVVEDVGASLCVGEELGRQNQVCLALTHHLQHLGEEEQVAG
jgi:hypothetical protein